MRVSHLILLAFVLPAPCKAGSWLFVSLLEDKSIVTFERDTKSGELTRRHTTKCPAEPACMAASSDGKTLFVSLRSTGQLASFGVDNKTGELTPLNVVDGGADPAYLLPDAGGRFLLSAYYAAAKVSVHRIGPSGKLSTKPLQTIKTAEKAHGIVLASNNQFALVPHTGPDRIYQFRFDAKRGRLSANQPTYLSTPKGDHPRHIAMHPSERWAYVSNEASDSIGVLSFDRKSGTLKHIQSVSSLPPDFDGTKNSTARCEMTPDGRFVYVANRGHDSIACFAIDQSTGLVKSLGQVTTEQTPRSFTIDPTGRFLYAAGQGSGRIAAFRIRTDGTLTCLATYKSGPVSWWALAIDN